jgi:hypothetical protein
MSSRGGARYCTSLASERSRELETRPKISTPINRSREFKVRERRAKLRKDGELIGQRAAYSQLSARKSVDRQLVGNPTRDNSPAQEPGTNLGQGWGVQMAALHV